jgi:acyl dehydratase
VEPGQALPPLDVPLTATGIVAGAIASRDYQDVHHDADAARRQGLPNVFMNILTTNGYVGRYATDWAGPEALLQGIAIRLGVPNLPGDTMTLAGHVAAREGNAITLAIEGRNALGSHVSGSVRLVLPPRGPR